MARLLPILLVCICLSTLPPVWGAGYTRQGKRTSIPADFPESWPTADELGENTELYQRFPRAPGAGPIPVHVVPHTHDDVGWLKTVDQYYLGANNSIQHAAVRYILDTVVEELMKDPSRKFVYVEQAFFQLWWQRQDEQVQQNVRNLVANGQLEFINGGYCMHDEANTHYLDMIDQTTLGHQFILQEFGVTPTIGWQIDPFGHSATQAALLSGVVGFEGLFFGRIDHQDHDQRMAAKNMEFIWRPSPSLGTNGQVFTGAFQNGNYGPTTGFCFDLNCDDPPIIEDDRFIDYNIPNRVNAFVDQIYYQAIFTQGENLMITMGSDFQYESAREWYQNLDRLMTAVNADGRVNMFYSTPSAYVKAKNAENNTYTVKTDDFFPYSDDDHSYWTGYMTSRPSFKRYVRSSSGLLQAARQVEFFSGDQSNSTLRFSEAVGIVQHHDAVAGTAKQHVTFDYAQRLHIGQTAVEDMMATGFADLVTAGHSGASAPAYEFCELANITICELTTTASPTNFQVLFYNPMARSRSEYVSIPISPDTNLVVVDSTGTVVQTQVTTTYNVSSHTPESAQQSLNFIATVPGLGYQSYFVVPASEPNQVYHEPKPTTHKLKKKVLTESVKKQKSAATYVSALRPVTGPEDTVIENEFISLTFDGTTNLVKTLVDKISGTSIPFGVSYAYYDSYAADGQKSGAYIFRPATEQPPTPIMITTPQLFLQTGPLVQEVVQICSEWVNQTFRVVAGQPFIEIEYTVGSVPIDDGIGKEVVIQYQTHLVTQSLWSSDSNAREMIQRQRNHRSSFNLTVTEPIAGNYVPMNAAAFITDGTTQLTVLNDRSQGVVSMEDGILEIMVHRRTLQDDARGVGEPMNETSYMSPYPDFIRQGPGLIITGKHYLFFGNASEAARVWRPVMQRVYQPFVPVYAPMSESVQTYLPSHNVLSTYLATELPINVDLISFQSWQPWSGDSSTVLIRLAHQFAVGEDSFYAQPVQVDLNTLFTTAPVNIQQMSLTATSSISSGGSTRIQKLQWNTDEPKENNNLDAPTPIPVRDSIVTLSPMEILTFIVTF